MPKKQSAGVLLYRRRAGEPEVFLVHPGGPFWAKKDDGAWSIPKGEFADDEDALAAAKREFAEETGVPLSGPLVSLGDVRQRGGKVVHAWAAEGDCDAEKIRSNPCRIEWPPRSGRIVEFPEVDRAAWFPLATAATKLNQAQVGFLERLAAQLGLEDLGR